MSRQPATVLAGLLAISPPGAAFPLDNQPGDVWPRFLAPLAAEISRFEGFAEDQVTEVDPRDAVYLLPDYVRMLGPDPYGRDASVLTTLQTQQLAYQRLTARGGQSIQYFVGLAAALGVPITITDGFKVTECGDAECGDSLAITPQELCWLVTAPAAYAVPFAQVQVLIAANQPAHGQVVFGIAG